MPRLDRRAALKTAATGVALAAAEGADTCVAGLNKIAGHAEKKGVSICLEHLNSRDDTHPMKGHPGYQGDDVDYVDYVAGNPGRGELDEHQEINYPPIMRQLLAIGYAGWVGQEFIPTRDPLAGLQHAVALCDV